MSRFKVFVDFMLAVLVISLIILGIFQVRTQKLIKAVKPLTDQVVSINAASTSDSGFSLLEQANLSLQASVSSLLQRLEKIEKTDFQNPAPANPATSSPPRSVIPAFQAQDIFLGSATTNSTSWVDTGQETSLYSGHYPDNVKAYFEAGLSIIGGEAWARLKNKTTGAVISITELSHNNNTVTWKNSPAFKLHSGNNTYVVQLKSTSGETANLTGARIKISQ